MKKRIVSLLVGGLLCGAATAQDHRFGVGGMVGEPIGASFKAWISERAAVDGGLGWSFRDEANWQLHADYLFDHIDLYSDANGRLPFYYGVGCRVKFQDRQGDKAGIRAPVGVSYMFSTVPLDVFAEIAPVLDVTPTTKLEITGGVGVRYWF